MKYLQMPEFIQRHAGALSGLQMAIWCDAWTWQQQGMDAYRTNEQLAEMFGVNCRSVRRAVSKLEQMGLVTITTKGIARMITAKEDQTVQGRTNRSGGPIGPQGRTNRSGGEDQSVRKGGPIGPPSREVSKSISREVSREKAFSRKFWDSDEFEMAWNEWKEYRLTQHQFEHRAAKYEELELHQLHQNTNGDERTAIEAIATAITRGWRGIFPRTPKSGENIGRSTDWARDVAQRLQERHSNQ